jgi:hypothetical protein
MPTLENISYETEARMLVQDFSPEGIVPNASAAEQYTRIFLEDYRLALASQHTTPESFLHAYTYRAMAVLAGAREESLDRAAYEVRQRWASAPKEERSSCKA